VRETIAQGIAAFRHNLVLCGWLYLLKLALALMVTVPLLIQIQLDLENSLFARPLLGDWSFGVIAELFSNRTNLATSMMLFLGCVAALALILKQFLNGGIFSTLLRGGRADIQGFFSDGAKLFVGNMKITIIMAIIYALLLIPGNFLIKLVPSDLFGHYNNPQVYVAVARYIVLYIIFVLAGILSDLARFRIAAFPGDRISLSFRWALNFYRANWVQAIGIYAICFVPFVLFWLVVERLALVVTGGLGNMLGVIVELLLFQSCSLVRTGQSLLFASSAAAMIRHHSRDWPIATSVEVAGD
jgi:hypothetical protein